MNKLRQADISRAIRAAQQCGAGAVIIQADGTIRIDPDDPRTRSFGERPGKKQHRPSPASEASPLAALQARWERREITLDQLPPGQYPNGMRVYADGEWAAVVRSRPLGKRELASLKSYFEAAGSPNFSAGGPETNDRLEVRGLIEVSKEPPAGRAAHYRITEAGKVEWQRLSTKND